MTAAGEVRATTLDRRGRPGAIDVLGDGDFTIVFEQEQALTVTPRGVATIALVTDQGPAIAQRPPGGRFSSPTPVAPGMRAADAYRITSAPSGEVVASWTSNETLREPLNVGVPTTALATQTGTFGPPLTGDVTAADATFLPSSAPLDSGRAVLVWHRLDPSGSSAALWLAPVNTGTIGPARAVTDTPAYSGIVEPLADGRAPLLWSAQNGNLETRLIDASGVLSPVASPPGRERFADDALYGTRVLYTAGRYALIAWDDVNGRLRASTRHF